MTVKGIETKDQHIHNLAKIVGGARSILYHKEDLLAYDCDAFTVHRHLPEQLSFLKIRRKFPGLSNTVRIISYLSSLAEQVLV